MNRFDERTALVIVDVQNDFADPSGSLAVTGGEAIVPRVNDAIAQATEAEALVVATQDWHPGVTPHFSKDGGIWPVHCVRGTWGAELHPDLVLPAGALRIRKGTNGEDGYSGFTVRDPLTGQETATKLEARLRARGIERLVVCGLATDYCVRATALDGARLGFEVELLADAVAAVDLTPDDGERALAEMADAGIRMGWEPSSRLARPADDGGARNRDDQADERPAAIGGHEAPRGEWEVEALGEPHEPGEDHRRPGDHERDPHIGPS